jgi:hypothetical protein
LHETTARDPYEIELFYRGNEYSLLSAADAIAISICYTLNSAVARPFEGAIMWPEGYQGQRALCQNAPNLNPDAFVLTARTFTSTPTNA